MQRKPPRAKLRKLVGATHHGDPPPRQVPARRHRHAAALLVHLGMTGPRAASTAKATPRAEAHARRARSRRRASCGSPMRGGSVRSTSSTRADEREHAGARGARARSARRTASTSSRSRARAKGKKATLKAFVLDQSVLAGVGNIYASEALWRAKLRPTTRAHRLTAERRARLAAAIDEMLEQRARQRRHDACATSSPPTAPRATTRTICGSTVVRVSRVCAARRRSGAPSTKDGQRITVQRVRPRKRSTALGVTRRVSVRRGRKVAMFNDTSRRRPDGHVPEGRGSRLRGLAVASSQAGLQLHPAVRRRQGDGRGSAAGSLHARHQGRGGLQAAGQVHDVALHHRAQPVR